MDIFLEDAVDTHLNYINNHDTHIHVYEYECIFVKAAAVRNSPGEQAVYLQLFPQLFSLLYKIRIVCTQLL